MKAFVIMLMLGTALRTTREAKWRGDIAAQSKLFNNYFKDGNFEAMSGLFTEDCTVMPPGAQLVTGREAVCTLFSSMADDGVTGLEMTPVIVVANKARFAADMGVLRVDSSCLSGAKKYVTLWKRENRQAKIYSFIWNDKAGDLSVRNTTK